MASLKDISYIQLHSCVIEGINVLKLQSKRTGIVVYLGQVEGPSVDGFICLATEAHDHDGLPHTLEHLVFMGSEDFPYKGVLDLLANRCLAEGTNAWTDVDHTCYTVTTAGRTGFLNLLPIYLDHILYPTLTDAAFLTEVHHVNGDGEDAGVVYCEMQARENTPEDMTHFELLQHMYPGVCGYKSETGGRLENLRRSTSNEKVQSYHHSYYRPDNLAITVVGKVTPDEIFKAIYSLEEKIVQKGPLPPMERPWQSHVPPFQKSVDMELTFPTEDESVGMVRLAWRGPFARDRLEMAAVTALLEYLSVNSVAPLQREMVEIRDPLCSEISSLLLENAVSCIGFTFSQVPVEKLDKVKDKVFEVLSGLVNGTEVFDIVRMRTMLKRSIRKNLELIESSPHYFFSFGTIGDFLFSKQPSEFPEYLNSNPLLKQMLNEESQFWVQLIETYLLKAPHVVIRGRPSQKVSKDMNSIEKERIKRQQQLLGEGGLVKREESLSDAIKQNEVPPPSGLLTQVKVPDPSEITFHTVTTLKSTELLEEQKSSEVYSILPVDQFPFCFQLNQIHSSFVEILVVLDTSVVPVHLKHSLDLLLEMLFELPIMRHGKLISYKEVVSELAEDTIEYEAGLGFNNQLTQAAFISIKMEVDKYAKCIQWLEEILYCSQITPERIQVIAQKLLKAAIDLKRSGRQVSQSLIAKMLFNDSSNLNISNMATQQVYLQETIDKLTDAKLAEEVTESLRHVKELLVAPGNLRVYLNGNVTKLNTLGDPLLPWKPWISRATGIQNQSEVKLAQVHLQPSPWGRSFVYGNGAVDSTFLSLAMPCIKSFKDPDYPAILCFMQYLCALEGPMWCQLRGMGLSYHYSMKCKVEEGVLYFNLFKSAQPSQAFSVAKEIVSDFVNEVTSFEHDLLEAAISSTVFQIVEQEKTISSAAEDSVVKSFYKKDPDYNKKLLKAVAMVTVEDLKRVGKLYFTKLFTPNSSCCSICCTPNKSEEMAALMAKLGWQVTIVEDLTAALKILN